MGHATAKKLVKTPRAEKLTGEDFGQDKGSTPALHADIKVKDGRVLDPELIIDQKIVRINDGPIRPNPALEGLVPKDNLWVPFNRVGGSVSESGPLGVAIVRPNAKKGVEGGFVLITGKYAGGNRFEYEAATALNTQGREAFLQTLGAAVDYALGSGLTNRGETLSKQPLSDLMEGINANPDVLHPVGDRDIYIRWMEEAAKGGGGL
jgi:hypothetical protein